MPIEGLLQDLRAGAWGAAMPKLQRAISATVRLRRIPPPRGQSRWGADDLAELTQEFVAGRTGPGRLTQLAVAATSEDHCAKVLDTLVRNFLADRARSDPRTKLRRRVRAVCGAEPGLQVDGTVVRERSSLADVYAGDDAVLRAAARRTPVAPPPWRDGEREGPPTDRASLIAVCKAVVAAGGGAVRLDTLASVLVERLQVRSSWDDSLDDAIEPTDSITERTAPVSADDYVVAAAIWDRLDDDERELVTFVGTGGRTAVRESDTALGKSAAQQRLERLRPRLWEAVNGCASPEGVVAALFELHARWKAAAGQSDPVVRTSTRQGGGAPRHPPRSSS